MGNILKLVCCCMVVNVLSQGVAWANHNDRNWWDRDRDRCRWYRDCDKDRVYTVPEINLAAAPAAITLLAGGLLLLGERSRRSRGKQS